MKRALTADQVHYLNIGLMALSAALAWRFPFELFLFSYTVLGPLHYLTEISWLKDRGFYTRGRFDYLPLVLVGGLVTVLSLSLLGPAPKDAAPFLTCAAFLAAGGLAFLQKSWARWGALPPLVAAAWFLSRAPFAAALFGVFLPTLIHVFLFTGAFLLAGALKGRSLPGLLACGVFGGLAAFLLFFHGGGHAAATLYARENYGTFGEDGLPSNPFIGLNFLALQALGLHQFGRPGAGGVGAFIGGVNHYLYQDPTALSLMAFIAYAYTYHYLNWFSKTSVIRWHEVPRARLGIIGAAWLGSLALSAFDYQTGFRWLFFLSFTHVLLEFPLNHLTWVGIGKELLGRRAPDG